MGFFDDIFDLGGLFDFNKDGKTDFGEALVGNMIINDCMNDNNEESEYSSMDNNKTLYDKLDDNWKLYCEDGSAYGIAPNDYDLEEDYIEALEEAKLAYDELNAEANNLSKTDTFTIPLGLTFEFTYPGKEQLEAINESDYPNKRTYEAAYNLCELEYGTPYIPSDSSKEKEAKRFNFILSGNCIAAKYLTPFDGFIYAQAVKENFTLPIFVENEDENATVYFPKFLIELAEESPSLAVEVWAWCVKEFGPYQQYMKIKSVIYNYIISSVNDYPSEFLDIAIDKLGNNVSFCDSLLSRNPDVPYGISYFIHRALEQGKGKEAQMIFTAVILNPILKSKDVENLINSVISACSNWQELETMNNFKLYILPIIKKMNDKRIKRVLPNIIHEVEHYITTVEAYEEKYHEDPPRKEEIKYISHKSKPQAVTNFSLDNTVYKFCAVLFQNSSAPYTYLCELNDVKIGDFVVVPVGNKNREAVAQIISLSQHTTATAPLEIKNAKKVLRIYNTNK